MQVLFMFLSEVFLLLGAEFHRLKDAGMLRLGKVIDGFRALSVGGTGSNRSGRINGNTANLMKLFRIDDMEMAPLELQDGDFVGLDRKCLGQFGADLHAI